MASNFVDDCAPKAAEVRKDTGMRAPPMRMFRWPLPPSSEYREIVMMEILS